MDLRFLLLSGGALVLALLSFFAGVSLYGQVLRALGPSLVQVATTPSELGWSRVQLGVVLALPALCAWVGALVAQLRFGQLPSWVTLLLLYALPGLAVSFGLLARVLALRIWLPVMMSQMQGLSIQLSLTGLALSTWAMQACVVAGVADILWMSLRRTPGYTPPAPQHRHPGAR